LLAQCIPGREGTTARLFAGLSGRGFVSNDGSKQKVGKLEVMVPVKYSETINPRTQKVVQSKRLLMSGYVMVKCVLTVELFEAFENLGQVGTTRVPTSTTSESSTAPLAYYSGGELSFPCW